MSKGQHRQRSRGQRQRGFDDDNYSAQDVRDDRHSRSYSASPGEPPAGQGPVLDASVKMFNTEKGFGFVSLADGSGDAFLHIGILQAAGHDAPPIGATLRVQIGRGPKGPQVTAVLGVDSTHMAEQPGQAPRRHGARQVRPESSTATEILGTVKWFNPEKGFGFIEANDGGTDVFLHISVVERAGLQTLVQGATVSMRVVETQKGREAISIAATT